MPEHAFQLEFTINANFVYIQVEATFSKSIVCPNHYSQYFKWEWYIALFIVYYYVRPADFDFWPLNSHDQLQLL